MTPFEFFRELYGEGAPGYLALWCRQSKATVWLPANDLEAIGYEAEKLSQTDDVYFGACLQEANLGSNRRGGAQSAIGMGGVWGDIDIAGPGHADQALPPTMEAAVKLACSMSDLPSALVETGGGIHAWWMFDKPWIFADTADRIAAADLVRSHQAGLRAVAARSGWKLDATHDLARVLRVPGTLNRKLAEPRPVQIAARRGARVPRGDLRTAPPPPVWTFDEAVAQYNSTHTYGWPKSGGTCPVCLHRECFGRMDADPNRWICFSANHGAVGVAGNACRHGDALDLDAHARRLTRAELLRESGLLAPGAAVPQDPITEPQAGQRQLKHERFSDVTIDLSRPMLVEDWLPHEAFGVIYGPSGTGKSFFSLDLALHVAMGWSWFGRTVTQGTVVYVAAEAPNSIRARIVALNLHYPHLRDVPIHLVPEPIDLLNDDTDVDALIAKLIELAGPGGMSLVIVDTLARTMAGGDENEFRTMSLLTSRLEKIRAQAKTTVLAVHHTGKTENKGARGHSSLKAAAETMIELSRAGEDGNRVALLEKSRDGEDGLRVGFALVPVEIGRYPNGKVATSAVVGHLTAAEIRKPLEGRALECYDVLRKLLDQSPAGVHVDRWQEETARHFYPIKPTNARSHFRKLLPRLVPVWVQIESGVARIGQEPRIPRAPFSDPQNPRLSSVKNDKTEDSRKAASGAQEETEENRGFRDVPRSAKAHRGTEDPPFRGSSDSSGSPAESSVDEQEARARVESLRTKTPTSRQQSEEAFNVVQAKFKPEDLE